MHLRRLELKDAPLMLAWMHDPSVVDYLHSDFASKTIIDAERLIAWSQQDNKNLNLAIVSDKDEYMGTVSLKHIENGRAEFAIVVRSEAMGRGYSWFAMNSMLEKAFRELDLEIVYWCVSRSNVRALRFYDKHNFQETHDLPQEVFDRYDDIDDLKWYSVLKGDRFGVRKSVGGCKVINIETNQIWDTIKDCALYYNITPRTMYVWMKDKPLNKPLIEPFKHIDND